MPSRIALIDSPVLSASTPPPPITYAPVPVCVRRPAYTPYVEPRRKRNVADADVHHLDEHAARGLPSTPGTDGYAIDTCICGPSLPTTPTYVWPVGAYTISAHLSYLPRTDTPLHQPR